MELPSYQSLDRYCDSKRWFYWRDYGASCVSWFFFSFKRKPALFSPKNQMTCNLTSLPEASSQTGVPSHYCCLHLWRRSANEHFSTAVVWKECGRVSSGRAGVRRRCYGEAVISSWCLRVWEQIKWLTHLPVCSHTLFLNAFWAISFFPLRKSEVFPNTKAQPSLWLHRQHHAAFGRAATVIHRNSAICLLADRWHAGEAATVVKNMKSRFNLLIPLN